MEHANRRGPKRRRYVFFAEVGDDGDDNLPGYAIPHPHTPPREAPAIDLQDSDAEHPGDNSGKREPAAESTKPPKHSVPMARPKRTHGSKRKLDNLEETPADDKRNDPLQPSVAQPSTHAVTTSPTPTDKDDPPTESQRPSKRSRSTRPSGERGRRHSDRPRVGAYVRAARVGIRPRGSISASIPKPEPIVIESPRPASPASEESGNPEDAVPPPHLPPRTLLYLPPPNPDVWTYQIGWGHFCFYHDMNRDSWPDGKGFWKCEFCTMSSDDDIYHQWLF